MLKFRKKLHFVEKVNKKALLSLTFTFAEVISNITMMQRRLKMDYHKIAELPKHRVMQLIDWSKDFSAIELDLYRHRKDLCEKDLAQVDEHIDLACSLYNSEIKTLSNIVKRYLELWHGEGVVEYAHEMLIKVRQELKRYIYKYQVIRTELINGNPV